MTLKHFIVVLISISIINCSCSRKNELRLYPVEENGKYGYIDSTGKLVIPFNFNRVGSFSEGLALAYTDSGYGYINTKGDFIIKPKYYVTTIPVDLLYQIQRPYTDTFGVSISFMRFNNGRALFFDHQKQMYGYIDKKGEIVIEPKFYYATNFKDGYALVISELGKGSYENVKYNIIDVDGKFLFEKGYNTLTRLSGNYINATTYVQKSTTLQSSSVILNRQGKIVNTISHGNMLKVGAFSNGFCIGFDPINKALQGRGYFIFDSTGSVLKDIKSNENYYFDDVVINNGKYFWVKLNEKYSWFKLDKNRNIQIIDTKLYNNIRKGFNSNGIACVKYSNNDNTPPEYGFIDTTGKFIIEPRYSNATDFEDGLAFATQQNGPMIIKGYINRNGVFVWSRQSQRKF